MYLHPSVNPSLTHFLGEFPGEGLALIPDVMVPTGHILKKVYNCREMKNF